MKKIWPILLIIVLLCGCYGNNDGFDRAMALRTSLLNGQGCQFEAEITADFGDKTYSFMMDCMLDAQGNMEFTVESPDYIAGISGAVRQSGGKLVFDDVALTFPLQSEDLLSPVSGPWLMVKAIRSGYVHSCSTEQGLFRMTVDDSYNEDALTLDIWIDGNNGPVRADIYEENRRIMTITVTEFRQM